MDLIMKDFLTVSDTQERKYIGTGTDRLTDKHGFKL